MQLLCYLLYFLAFKHFLTCLRSDHILKAYSMPKKKKKMQFQNDDYVQKTLHKHYTNVR